MKVRLDRIEQTPNGAAHIVFNSDSGDCISFDIPKAFADRATRFIVENTFTYGIEMFIDFVTWEQSSKDSMWITCRSSVDGLETRLQITQYIINKED